MSVASNQASLDVLIHYKENDRTSTHVFYMRHDDLNSQATLSTSCSSKFAKVWQEILLKFRRKFRLFNLLPGRKIFSSPGDYNPSTNRTGYTNIDSRILSFPKSKF